MATVKTPQLNLTDLFANAETSGNLSININKEGDKIVINVNSHINDRSIAPLSSNNSTNANYSFEGTPAAIKTKITADLALGTFIAV